jgi:hypothetical protein
MAGFRVTPAGFNPANGLQQATGQVGAALGFGNGGAA